MIPHSKALTSHEQAITLMCSDFCFLKGRSNHAEFASHWRPVAWSDSVYKSLQVFFQFTHALAEAAIRRSGIPEIHALPLVRSLAEASGQECDTQCKGKSLGG